MRTRTSDVADKSLFTLLRESCTAFHRYEDLRHMSDAALAHHGLTRDTVCRRLFEELHGGTRPRNEPRGRHH